MNAETNTDNTLSALFRGMALCTYFTGIAISAVGGVPASLVLLVTFLTGAVPDGILFVTIYALINMVYLGLVIALARARSWQQYTYKPQVYIAVTLVLLILIYVNINLIAPGGHLRPFFRIDIGG